ncbi:30S ribosomal protein S20 [Vampirovibrio sp.]|uniref:30S ribosomal protein S20 n=1 Tax=Vampirovibrio sp. TaxID=2717857 RepID=UPI0035945B2E
MPRIKSAKKRVDVAERNRQRNIALKSAIKTALKKALNGESTAREEGLKQAYSLMDRAVLKGIMHKNTAARYKSKIAVALNKAAVA